MDRVSSHEHGCARGGTRTAGQKECKPHVKRLKQVNAASAGFLQDSELSQLNRSAGQWFDASTEMMDVLQKARHFFDVTDGLFDPTVLPDLVRVGYDRSMDEIRAQNNIVSSPASDATPKADFHEMELDLNSSRVRLPKNMQLDFGGIAKGWIVDQAVTC